MVYGRFPERLLNTDDPVSRKLLQEACFYIIPNMNIDGAIAGNLRASASGVNLNREWQAPSPKKSPEVYHTLKKMDETGVDLMLDVHGDEVLPYNFIAASEGIPGYNDYIKTYRTEVYRTLDGYFSRFPGHL